MNTENKKVVVSGMRPTGKLHLGHFHGVIENWAKLQKENPSDEFYFFIADLHSLTTNYDQTQNVRSFSKECLIDWLAYGIDPEKATLFVQSQVPEHSELHLLLSMITPLGWLERVPTYKELQNELKNKDLSTYGFLGYPLLQTADVAIYFATHVPVGQDQVAHIELSREIVRRFNHIYKNEIFPEPQALLTNVPKLLGTDGRKMSKSYNNCIYLSDSAEDVRKKMMPAKTDPARMRKTDPGDPEKCSVFDYHKIYTSEEQKQEIRTGCTTAGIGCVDCKKMLIHNMNEKLEPYREKRKQLEQNTSYVDDIVAAGNTKAKEVAGKNLTAIKEVVGL